MNPIPRLNYRDVAEIRRRNRARVRNTMLGISFVLITLIAILLWIASTLP